MDLNPDPTRATADAYRALLPAHGLRLSAATGSFICTKPGTCGIEIRNCRKALAKHLAKWHKVLPSVRSSLWLAASRLSADFPATHSLREKYKSGGGRHGCLPKIDGLPIVWCKECPTCSRLFPSDEGLRRHFNRMHDGISRKDTRALKKFHASLL